MITEDYVSFETAKLLKKKGFNEECEYFYDEHGENEYVICSNGGSAYNDDEHPTYYSMPTLQMAMKWLREVHQYIIEIHYGNVGSSKEPEIQWWWELENKQGEFLSGNIIDGNTTYEQACEEAIQYSLKNLI